MSSKNTRKEISSRPSLIPRRTDTKVSSQSSLPIPKCTSKDNGEKNKSYYQGVRETYYQTKERLQRKYPNRTDKKELKKPQEKVTATVCDPPSLRLPPPTKEFYDTSFLDFVSDIINKHQQEEYKINTDNDDRNHETDIYDDDESRVEKPRREADPTKRVERINLPIESPINLLGMGNEEDLVGFELDFDSIVIDCLDEECEKVDDLKLIDQLHVPNTEDNTVENNSSKDHVEISELGKSFFSNDFSWLCFDSEDEFVRFKLDCEKKGLGSLFEEPDPNHSLLQMERVLVEGSFMSPIRINKTKPIYHKSPKITETSSDEIENVTAKNLNKDLGEQNKNDISSNQTKSNNNNEEKITRVTDVNTYEENSSIIEIEKHILRSSTPTKAISVVSNRAADKEVPSKDHFDYYADCRGSAHACKRKSTYIKEEKDKNTLRRTPPLFKFPPRKRRTY